MAGGRFMMAAHKKSGKNVLKSVGEFLVETHVNLVSFLRVLLGEAGTIAMTHAKCVVASSDERVGALSWYRSLGWSIS